MPVFLYLFSIFLSAIVFSSVLFYIAYDYGNYNWKILSIVGLLSFLGSLQLSVSLVN